MQADISLTRQAELAGRWRSTVLGASALREERWNEEERCGDEEECDWCSDGDRLGVVVVTRPIYDERLLSSGFRRPRRVRRDYDVIHRPGDRRELRIDSLAARGLFCEHIETPPITCRITRNSARRHPGTSDREGARRRHNSRTRSPSHRPLPFPPANVTPLQGFGRAVASHCLSTERTVHIRYQRAIRRATRACRGTPAR